MERTQVLELMGTLKLYGMRSAYDEVMGNGIKRQHEPPRIVGDLLQSEIAEKQARSIRYQLSIAKLPLAKDIDDFDFKNTPSMNPCQRPCDRHFCRRPAQCRPGRRHRHRQEPSGHRHCPRPYPQRHTRPVLQRCRSRQSP